MPATETLLKKLKETLGEEAASDLVTWVDHSSAREIAQLRELADLHYSRFDARLEQRLAELEAGLRTEMGQAYAALRTEMGQAYAALRTEMGQGQAALRTEMGQGQAALRTEMAQGQAGLRTEMANGLAALRVEMASLRADMMKWMFIYWMGTIIPLAGLMVGLVKLVT